jgi:predicted transcriptional regulator
MSKPDIIMYLDVNKFVPNAESWECLWEESQRHQKGNLKAWLKQQYGVTIETVDVEEAARDLDDIHPDISGLVDVCT